LKPQKVQHRAALIAPREVGNLLRKIYQYGGEGFSVAYCLKILPYLALRSEEIRGARWTEIDLENIRHSYCIESSLRKVMMEQAKWIIAKKLHSR
jgi:integrase